MEIGTMLRNKRKILGLTQDQFIHGIISKSFYSKVERGLNEISAKDLFAILEANNINLNDFINNAGSTSKSDRLKVEILVAFNNKNIHEVQELNKKIQVSNCDQTIKLSSLLINAILNNQLDKINLNTRNEIKKKLFDVEKWWNNVYTLQLFCNSMLIFSFDDLTFYMQQLTKQKNINSLSFDVQRSIGSICINYFHNCYKNHQTDCAKWGYQIIDSLAKLPDLAIYRIIKNYYQNFFTGNQKEASKIIDFFKDYDLKEIYTVLP